MRARIAAAVAAGIVAIVLTASAPREAAGGGFALDQGGRAGSAFIGEAALGEDAVTLYYNPAGATRLPGSQLALGGQLVEFKAEFENHDSIENPKLGGAPLRGTPDANGGEIAEVGALSVTHQLSKRWWLGLAVSAPFGLLTEYDAGWVGRYHALNSNLKTIDVAPTVAFKVLDELSLGAGLDVQYAYAKLSSSLDLGGLCELNAPKFGTPASACGLVGLTPQSTDGYVRIRGTSWAVGYNVGLLWEPTAATRVGLSYRSRVDQTISGEAQFSIPKRAHILQQLSGALVNSGGSADLDLPDTIRLAIYHDIDPRWAIMTGVDVTRWSIFDNLVFRFDNPKQPPLMQPERFQDTLRTGLAVIYRLTDRWRLRGAFAYDETPVPNPERRTPRIPDHDRYGVALGATAALTDTLVAEFGYMRAFTHNARIDNRDPLTGNILRGSFTGGGNVFGAQIAWRFH